jgi:hypothetical protein
VSVYNRDQAEFELGHVAQCDEAGTIMKVSFELCLP